MHLYIERLFSLSRNSLIFHRHILVVRLNKRIKKPIAKLIVCVVSVHLCVAVAAIAENLGQNIPTASQVLQ